ncbi:hypothetical protein ABSA28_01028 [Candidatus Hepatincolaceae symbiont of Richtersius coronifer]
MEKGSKNNSLEEQKIRKDEAVEVIEEKPKGSNKAPKSKLGKIFSFINNFILFLIGLLILFLYYILLELPIPFATKFLKAKIYSSYPSYFPEESSLVLGSISLSWNYNLNRPMVLIKNAKYINHSSTLDLAELGIYFSLVSFIKENKLDIRKIYVKGLDIIGIEENGKYNIEIKEKTLEPSSQKTVSRSPSLRDIYESSKFYKTKDIYGFIQERKKNNDILKNLDEIVITNSTFVLVPQKTLPLIFNIDNATIRDRQNIVANIQLAIVLNNQVELPGDFSFSASLGTDNKIKATMNISKINLGEIQKQGLLGKYSKQLTLTNLPASLKFTYNYNFKTDIHEVGGEVSLEDGRITYKKLLSKPLILKNFTSTIKYSSKDNILHVQNLNLNFANNNRVAVKALGSNLLLNKVSAVGKINLHNYDMEFSNVVVESDKNKALLKIAFTNQPDYKKLFELNVEGENLKLPYIKASWPKEFYPEIKKWVITNIQEAHALKTDISASFLIKEGDFTITKFAGKSSFNDVNITYLKGLPNVSSNFVILDYDLNQLNISYDKAASGGIYSDKGNILFYDFDPQEGYQLGIGIDLALESDISNGLRYLDNEVFDLISGNKLNLDNFQGEAQGNLSLLYDFDNEKIITPKVNMKLQDVVYNKAFKDQDVNKGNFSLKIENDVLNLLGDLEYLENQAELNILYSWQDLKNKVFHLFINFDKFKVQDLEKLDISRSYFKDYVQGEAKISLDYFYDNRNNALTFEVALANSNINLNIFNFKKAAGEELTIGGKIVFDEQHIIKDIENIIIKGDNINSNMHISPKPELTEIYFSKFELGDRNNFNGKILYGAEVLYIFLRGRSLDITSFLSNYIQNEDAVNSGNNNGQNSTPVPAHIILPQEFKQEVKEQQNQKIKNYNLDIKLQRVVSNNYVIRNLGLTLNVNNNKIKLLDFSGYANSKKQSTILYDNETKILGSKIYNLGYILEFFKLSNRIKNGDLESNITLYDQFDPETNQYNMISKGDIILSNFNAGVSFGSAVVKFKGTNSYFDVEKLNLIGNFFGGKFSGYLDYSKKYLHLNGKLIPIWGANNLISNAPIIRDILGNTNNKRNIVQFNSSIKGTLNNLEYSFFNKAETAKESVDNKENMSDSSTQQDVK